MSELKNLIVVDISDYENTLLVPSGIGATGEHDIKEIKGKGTFLIKNTSQKSRLWNLICDLKEVVNTNLEKVLNVGSVDPGQEYKREYEIQNLKTPYLKVLETVDAEREISGIVNNLFLYENPNNCNVKINLTNTLDIPFTEIKVTKELPPIFQDIDIKAPNFGNAELVQEGEQKILSWKIENLPGKETASLDVYCVVNVKERKDQNLGSLKVNYLINNKILTMIAPEVQGLTDSMSGVTQEEGSSPATWDCNVEFLNDSEFKVRLENVKVTHKIPTGTEDVVSENPNADLGPDQSWDKNFSIDSQKVPELESEIEFTTLFGVITRVIGEIIKEPTIYQVLSTEVNKSINPVEVAAYANTDMTIMNKIPNLGTSAIDTLEILDEIPQDFVPPLNKEIKIEIKNPEGTIAIQERAEYTKSIDIDPDDQNPESKHAIHVILKELYTQTPPNSEIIMTYPLLAKNPNPEATYNTPIEIKANGIIKGKELIIKPSEEPVLKIKYVARKFKTLKSVKPGLSEGEFSISVRIQNKGDVELENIIVKDRIPSGFTLSEFTPPEGATHNVIKKGEESELEVKIAELKGGASININYNCSGSSDYSRSEPHVVVMGRVGAAPSNIASEQIDTEKPGITKSKQVIIHDIFNIFYNKIEEGINCDQLGELLEEKRDNLPAGTALHQLAQYAKELKGLGDKAIVGGIKNEVIAKLNEFKDMYG